jgi:anthranilate synthase/aminodeoxychorismate synthase-like glutamine amidotransferase
MRRVLVLDNYDSFTFNLVQLLREKGAEVLVRRNDALDVAAAQALAPTHLVLSPGPGRPENAGITLRLIAALAPKLPVLGVCLGHQALGLAFGGRVVHAARPQHGEEARVFHDGRGLFRGLSSPLAAARYHSLVVAEQGFPEALEVSAWTAEGEIMGLRHRSLPVEGVQFHPESVLTPRGARLIANFLALTAGGAR